MGEKPENSLVSDGTPGTPHSIGKTTVPFSAAPQMVKGESGKATVTFKRHSSRQGFKQL